MSARSRVFEIDRGRIWGYALPRVAAQPGAIEAAERRLGGPLDPQYRGRGRAPNPVVWFSAGAVGDRWPDFESFLLGLMEFNRLDAIALETDPRMRDALDRLPTPESPAS